MSMVCKFSGIESNNEDRCPHVNNGANALIGGKIAVEFANNDEYNTHKGENLQGEYGVVENVVRVVRGALVVEGDLFVKGAILGENDFSIYSPGFNENITGDKLDLKLKNLECRLSDSSLSPKFVELETKNLELGLKVDKLEKIISVLCEKLSVDKENLRKVKMELNERCDVEKRLDAVH